MMERMKYYTNPHSFSQTIHNNMFFTTYIETVYAFIFGLGLVAWGSYYSRMPIFRFRNSDLYTMRNEENEKAESLIMQNLNRK